jgi:hypothetical protein
MTRRDYEKIAAGIDRIADEIKATIGNQRPKMVFQFDCSGRGKVVLRDQQKLVASRLSAESPTRRALMGLYTYGEIGPVGEHNCFHNFTASRWRC